MKKYLKYLVAFNLITISIITSICHSTNLEDSAQDQLSVAVPLPALAFDHDDMIEMIKAASQGCAEAQCNLGLEYFDGFSVPVDFNLAAKYFKQAADQSHPLAQYYLALCYSEGLGVKVNPLEAVRLFHHAAVSGNKESQEKLIKILQPIVLKPYNLNSKKAFNKLDQLILIVQKNNRETFEPMRDKNDPNGDYLKQNPKMLNSLKTFEHMGKVSRFCQELSSLKNCLMNPGFMVNCFKNARFFADTKDDEFLKSYDLNDEKRIFLNYDVQNVKNSKLINELMENMILLRSYYLNYRSNIEHYERKVSRLIGEINLRVEKKQKFKQTDNLQAFEQEEVVISHQKDKYSVMKELLENNIKLYRVFNETHTLLKKIMNWFIEDTERRNHLMMDTYPFLKNRNF